MATTEYTTTTTVGIGPLSCTHELLCAASAGSGTTSEEVRKNSLEDVYGFAASTSWYSSTDDWPVGVYGVSLNITAFPSGLVLVNDAGHPEFSVSNTDLSAVHPDSPFITGASEGSWDSTTGTGVKEWTSSSVDPMTTQTGNTTDRMIVDIEIQNTDTKNNLTVTLTHGASSYIYGPDVASTVSGSFTADAILTTTESGSFAVDAVIQVEQTGSFTVDANTQIHTDASFTADANIFATVGASFTVDADILATQVGTFSLDAVVQTTPTASFATDAILLVPQPGTVTANAVVERTIEAASSADAILSREVQAGFSLDAWLALVTGTVTGDFTADAVVLVPQSGTTTLDAVVLTSTATTFTADANIAGTVSSSFTLDAQVAGASAGVFSTDAVVSLVGACVWVSPANLSGITPTPTLVFRMPEASGNMHFQIELDTDSGFSDPTVVQSPGPGWQYWDGGGWQAVPDGGVPNTYSGNEARYTVQSPLSQATWYRRVRAGVI